MKLALLALVLAGCAGQTQTPGAPGGETLTPTGLVFDYLPIDSVRGQITGYDAAADLCVRAIWDFSNNNRPTQKHCDDFFEGFPYVSIAQGACAPATTYSGNVDFYSGAGCVDIDHGQVDVTLHVGGDIFTGAIRLKSP